MNMTNKQRTWMWIGGVILALYFAPPMINSVRQTMFYQQQAAPRPAPPAGGNRPERTERAQRADITSAAPDAVPAGASAGTDVFTPLLGKWQGRAVLVNRNGWGCALEVELREDGKHDGTVNGYTTLACSPVGNTGIGEVAACKADPLGCIKKMQEQSAPTSAILSGKVADGAIHLQAQENLSTTATGCVMASMLVRDFGAGRVAVTWRDACGGGQMVLIRAAK